MVTNMKIDYPFKSKLDSLDEFLDENERTKLAHKKCLFRSGDGFRVKWDLLIMLLAIYNCFMVPVQFCFDPKFAESIYFTITDMLINLIFLIDILINFRTSFIHPKTGDEVMDLKVIAVHYIKARFWIDLLA
jgi:hypothetical protein